jgi:hypothetical protein
MNDIRMKHFNVFVLFFPSEFKRMIFVIIEASSAEPKIDIVCFVVSILAFLPQLF